MRSWAVGEPPRCRWPRLDTRTSFRHKHYRRVLALAESVLDKFGKLVHLRAYLRDYRRLGARSYGSVEGKEASVAPHHLYEEKALVAGGSVADFVHTVHDGVERRVVAYRGVGAVQVVVNGARQADNRKVELIGENAGARQRAVAAYHDKSVYLVAAQHIVGQTAPLRSLKLLATRGFKYSAALLYYIRYILSTEIDYFI